jgi:hypothetical protein
MPVCTVYDALCPHPYVSSWFDGNYCFVLKWIFTVSTDTKLTKPNGTEFYVKAYDSKNGHEIPDFSGTRRFITMFIRARH